MSASPTQRTLALLREEGWLAEVVERWVPGANVRRDLFGFVDVLAIRGADTLAVQCTTAGHVANRVSKITDVSALPNVREAGWRIEVHGWRKSGNRWVVRRVDVS